MKQRCVETLSEEEEEEEEERLWLFQKNEKTKRRNEGKTHDTSFIFVYTYNLFVNSNNNAMGGGGEIALNDKKNVKNDNLALLSSSFRGQIFATADDVRKTKQNENDFDALLTTTVQKEKNEIPRTKLKSTGTIEEEEEEEEEEETEKKQKERPKQRRMRLDGLQNYGTEYCWAMDKSGKSCQKKTQKNCLVPYCSKHLRCGDDAFSTREHPLGIGKILIANFDLPKNYKMVYFGTRKPVRKLNKFRKDYMLSFWRGGGVIDPQDCPVSSKLQYMSNPGPQERSNVTCTNRMFGDTRDEGIVGREYKTTEFIPKGTQMLQFYGPQWFASRDIEKINVGTKKYPAPLKRKRGRIE